MALEIGDQAATSGMTKAIYDEMSAVLEPDLGELSEQDITTMREGWKKLSYAIAKGVIKHIKANMEIHDIKTEGEIDGNPVIFTQVSGTGSVE
jgi:hypothetical protein